MSTEVPAPAPLGGLVSELDPAAGWRILLVEDDDADALLVREMLADGLPGARVERVTNLADARKVVRDADCVLLDMGLPDGEGITGVARLVGEARDTSVVVLTGAASERQGVRAVAAGAQDYLVKGRVDDQLLARSIRYAVERQRAARLTRDLFTAERRRADNTRMERALIPTPLVRSSDVSVAVRYQAGREGAELGGDFYDTVESADGTVTVLIGDVAGHGPDAAALGARMRSAWRALTLAGLPQAQVLMHLDEFLRTEVEALTFATVAVLEVPADRATGRLMMAGHPPPVAVGSPAVVVGEGAFGHLLGVMESPEWTPVDVDLGPGAQLLLYTDGLIEGWAGPDTADRFGLERLIALIAELHAAGLTGTDLLDALLAQVQRCNGGPMTDDVAVCLVSVPEIAGSPRVAGEARAPRASRLTLRIRLSAILGLVALLLVGTLGAQLVLQSRQRDIRNDLLERVDPALVALGDLRAGLVDQETGVRGYALAGDPRFLEPYERGQGAAVDAAARLAELLGDSPLADEVRTVDELTETWRVELAEPSIAATQQGTGVAATDEFQVAGRQRFDAIRAAIDDVDDALSAERAEKVEDLDTAARRATIAIGLQALGLVLSGVLIVVALNRVVVGPIRRLGGDARRVAEGELDHPVRGERSPDLVALGEDVDAMRRRILDEVDQLNAASTGLARQADDLARSNADLEQFAYVASHDLQEPLRKVSSFCQLLQKRYAHQLDARANEYIYYAVDGAKRMQDLINDLLSFSRVGRSSDTFEAIDLNELASEVVEVLAPSIEDARATVEIGDLPTVPGDRRLLGAALQNLVSNALKFRGEEPPCIEITASLAAAPAGDEWVISVSDNGIGIEPDYSEQIFVIFKRLHSKTEYAGTGIGLSLAKKIMEFHGGRIWLADTPGPGSTFRLSLPALRPHERSTADAG